MIRKKLILISWMILVISQMIFAQESKPQSQEKMFIAVLEMDKAGITTEEARILTDRLRYELFETGKFTVLERSKMEDILKEQSFQMSGCTSNECLVEIGRLIGVQAMVGGSVGKIGNLYTLNVRLIDVETATVLKNAVVDYKGTLDGVLTSGLRKVARKLAGLPVSDEPMVKKPDVTDKNKGTQNTTKRDAGNASDQQITRKEQFVHPSVKVLPKKKRFHRFELDLGAGRANVTFEARSADGTLIARKTYRTSHIYASAKINLTRKIGLFAGVSAGAYQKSDFLLSNGEINSVNFVLVMVGTEYMIFRFISLGIGFHNTGAELGFKGFDQTLSYTQNGMYFRGGLHIPLTSRWQLDAYIYNGSGQKPNVSYFTFGVDFKL